MRWTPRLLLCLAVLPAHAVRRTGAAPLPAVRQGCERWLVTLGNAPELAALPGLAALPDLATLPGLAALPDLATLRDAVRAGAPARVAAEISRLEDQARARAAALAAPLAAVQGTVVHAYWLVPVCVVDLPQADLPNGAVDALRGLPGVRALHRCGQLRPW